MSRYHFCNHTDLPIAMGLPSALSDLEQITFSHYDGVVHSTDTFLRWYMARPGMAPQFCQAACETNLLVASLFVTLAPMVLAGETLLCGIIDTVMTHPDHRRRGLATTLIQRACEAMEAAGADLSLLYTARGEPICPPERLYRRLGYVPREVVVRFVRAPRPKRPHSHAASLAPDADARRLFEQSLGDRDGWLLLDQALWRWRRQERPLPYPVSLRRTADGAAAAVCTGELLVSGDPRRFAVISDLVLPEPGDAKGALSALAAFVPPDTPATILCPESEAHVVSLLQQAGFSSAGLEVAMLKPITDRGGRAMAAQRRPWYVAVESVIGV